ncbi:TPA: hypothetical protein JAJ28_003067 [Aeromonas hydrophila]|uniref:Lipoprotein n=1 Tax=Aeromonas hydrophila TaxID=644 RepID=A0AAD3UCD6_AERHY|nr:hypothetical protein [Aeromonas hydrophila]
MKKLLTKFNMFILAFVIVVGCISYYRYHETRYMDEPECSMQFLPFEFWQCGIDTHRYTYDALKAFKVENGENSERAMLTIINDSRLKMNPDAFKMVDKLK